MKVADLIAWSETLGVSIDEVPTVLRFRVRQVNALREDVVKAWGSPYSAGCSSDSSARRRPAPGSATPSPRPPAETSPPPR